jgi:hypothetical protein
LIQEFQLIVIPLDNNNLQWELSQCYYKKNRDFRGIEQFYQAWRKSYSSFFDAKFFPIRIKKKEIYQNNILI